MFFMLTLHSLFVNYIYKSGIASLCLRTVIPGFVKGHPTDNRRMVEIALHGREPIGSLPYFYLFL